MIDIERAVLEMGSGKKYTAVGSINLTDTSLTSGATFSMVDISTYSFLIYPVLVSGTAPTNIDVTFNKRCNIPSIGEKGILGTPFTKSITSGIVADPEGVYVNVDSLAPAGVFNALQIDFQATSGGAVDVRIDIVIVGGSSS